MREIKFRAWDGDRMQKVLTLGLNEGYVSTNKIIGDIEDFKILQFTGFLDSKGAEIYEGDILRCHIPVEIIDNGCNSIDGETIFADVLFDDGAFMVRAKTVNYPWVLNGNNTFLSCFAVEPSLITSGHYWMMDFKSDLHFELESNDWSNWELDIESPVNSIDFTIHALSQLHKFIHSELVSKLQYFSDYDKQAIEDSIYYLNEHKELLKLMDRAKKLAYIAAEDEEDRPRFKMDAYGNLTRIE